MDVTAADLRRRQLWVAIVGAVALFDIALFVRLYRQLQVEQLIESATGDDA